MLEAFIIIVIHYIADFIFQDGDWAVNKSKSVKPLLAHTTMYTFVWFVSIGLICRITSSDVDTAYFTNTQCINLIFLFPPITFIFHTITDYYTSKITSKMYENGNFGSRIPVFGFFSMVGFDQVLHYAQLFLTYYLLINL
jgi:hypothetical protein